jgi:hypothetical protein
MKVFLSVDDTFDYKIYLPDEALHMFGSDINDEYDAEHDFSEVPDELVEEYKAVFKRFWELNAELDKHTKSRFKVYR